MDNELKQVVEQAQAEAAGVSDIPTLQALRAKYLGKKGPLAAFFARMKDVPADQRRAFGQSVNEARSQVEAIFQSAHEALEAKVADLNAQLTAPNADYTALSAELAQTQSTLDAAVEQYLTLEEKAESLK